MGNYYWFSVFVATNALLLLVLAFNVSMLRMKHKISVGDGGNKELAKAIRTHANGTEQVPIFALLLLVLSYSQPWVLLLAALTMAFTLARLAHAYGMLFRGHLARRIGAGMTYLLQALAAVAALISLIIQ